jgi:nucleotide-binding universal stress UspA family protein
MFFIFALWYTLYSFSAQYVVQNEQTGSVMVAQQEQYTKVLVPLDGSGWSKRAISPAADIARSNNAELVLLHVFEEPAHEYIGQIALAGQDEQLQHMRQQVQQHLKGLCNELRHENIKVRIQWIEGRGVAHHICDYINDQDVDLVVMATSGRTGLARKLFGGVAEKVRSSSKTPVMLVAK